MTGFWRGCEMNWVSYPGRRSWRASRNSKRARWPTLIGRNGARATARKENKRRQPKRSAAPPIKGAAEIINKKNANKTRSTVAFFVCCFYFGRLVAASCDRVALLVFRFFFTEFLPEKSDGARPAKYSGPVPFPRRDNSKTR